MPDNKTNHQLPALLKGKGVPEYSEITPNEINIHIPRIINEIGKELDQLEIKLSNKLATKETIRWNEIMIPLTEISERLRWSWGVVSHLNAVANSKDLREAYSKQQPEVIRFSNRIGQSKILYNAINELKKQSQHELNTCQERIIDAELISMRNRGVGLEGSDKDNFNRDSERLAELSSIFSNNVLDATKEWSMLLRDKSEIEGIPKRALESFALAAKQAGDTNTQTGSPPTQENGPWRIGLDMPSYIPIITFAENRSLRETVYRAHVKRASDGKLNNQSLIEEILTLRSQQAQRLGYVNWAEFSLSTKMAKDIQSVEKLLEELRIAAFHTAKEELKEIKNCAKSNKAIETNDISSWDISFWSEKLRQEKYDLNQEALRPWFPLPQVLNGLFTLCNRLFEISIIPADGQAPIWHDDVRFFKVLDKNGSELAAFFLDPYSRPENKRGGAWMDECLTRKRHSTGEIILPIAYLVCNQTPPSDKTPSLMSFEEVQTLFHEFGHGLQHMLTTVNYPQAAGINNVEWDAVELPSQFMENWCLDRKTFSNLAKHWETKEPLPEKEFKKLVSTKTFNSGLATLRQIHFALTDIKLHSFWDKNLGKTPNELRREIAISTTVIEPIPEDQFLCAFNHIFAGGYSAGYYSYKWAEVLSSDAFAAFEEAGLENENEIQSIGKRFRDTILSMGGSQSPEEIFKTFRGRDASTNALIRHSGLLSKNQ